MRSFILGILKKIKLNDTKFMISIGFLWIFTIILVIGILTQYNAGFLVLLLPFMYLYAIGIILWNGNWKRIIIPISIAYGLSMGIEFLKVNVWSFEPYVHGENLGYEIFGVPLVLGLDWIVCSYCTAVCIRYFVSNIWLSSIFGALLVVFIFALSDISGAETGLWEIQHNIPPLIRYLSSGSIAFIIQLVFQKNIKSFHLGISIHIFLSILVFIMSFLFIEL